MQITYQTVIAIMFESKSIVSRWAMLFTLLIIIIVKIFTENTIEVSTWEYTTKNQSSAGQQKRCKINAIFGNVKFKRQMLSHCVDMQFN